MSPIESRLDQLADLNPRLVVLFAVECAERACRRTSQLTDPASAMALVLARRYADGEEVTTQDLRATA